MLLTALKEISLFDSPLTLPQKSAVITELAAVWSPAPLLESPLSIPSIEIDLEEKIIPALVLVLSRGFVESHFWQEIENSKLRWTCNPQAVHWNAHILLDSAYMRGKWRFLEQLC